MNIIIICPHLSTTHALSARVYRLKDNFQDAYGSLVKCVFDVDKYQCSSPVYINVFLNHNITNVYPIGIV